MMIRVQLLGLIVMGASFYSGAATAQREDADVHLRNDCRLAAQVLEKGHPAPHYAWAAETIPKCVDTGGEALGRAWERPPVDSVALEYLYYAGYTLRDSRVTAAVAATATNGSMPQLTRLNAIRVLTGHAVPSFMISIADLNRAENDSVRVYLGGVSHVQVRQGAHPIGAETIRSILGTLWYLRDDADARVARAAVYVHDQICGRLACEEAKPD